MAAESAHRFSRNFILLLATIFIATFASSMVSASPVPFLVKYFAKSQDATATFLGVLVSVNSVAVVGANFAGGFLADKIGRKRTIILGSAILVPSLFAYTFAPGLFWVLFLYFIQMFSISFFQPAFTALVADSSDVGSRGRAFGHYNLFWIGGTVPAPLIGGFLADALGLRFPFAIAALLSVFALITSFGLVEASHQTIAADSSLKQGEPEDDLMPFTSVLLIFGATFLLNGLLNGMISPLIRVYLIFKLNVTATELGLALSLGSGLMTTLVQIPGGRLADKFGRKPLVLIGFLGIPFVVAMAFTSSLLGFILATAGLVTFANLSSPAYSAWVMDLVPSAKRARTSGLFNAINGVGMFFGPLLSTWIYESQPNIIVPFAASTLPWILMIPLILKLKETRATKSRVRFQH